MKSVNRSLRAKAHDKEGFDPYAEPAVTPGEPTPASSPATEKLRVYRVTRPDEFGENSPWCVYRDWDTVRDAELDCADPGDKITIEIAEMTKEELDALPEFQGW